MLNEYGTQFRKYLFLQTALHKACIEGHSETVRILLRHKADVCMTSSNEQVSKIDT